MTIHQAYYTSCQQGIIPGRMGFQFNAVSPGVTPEQLRSVERVTSYQVPTSIETAIYDEVAKGNDGSSIFPQAPRCLLYRKTLDGVFVLAQIVYVGRDYTNRLGNVFAHLLFTDDPEDFSGKALIDTWSAPWWRQTEVADPKLPPFPGLELGDDSCIAEGFKELLNQSKYAEHLHPLLTAVIDGLIGSEPRRRVLIIDEPDTVAGWLTLISHIIPQSFLPDLTFTTYSGDPAGSMDSLVVGARQDSPRLQLNSPSLRASSWLFSFETGQFIEPEPTPYVRELVRMLIADEFDLLKQFNAWVDPALKAIRELRSAMENLLGLYRWLEQPNPDDRFNEVLPFLLESPAMGFKPLAEQVWNAMGELPLTPDSLVAGSQLANAQAARNTTKLEAAADYWWNSYGRRLTVLETDQLAESWSSIEKAGAVPKFITPELQERAVDALRESLDEVEESFEDAWASIGFFEQIGLINQRGMEEIRRFVTEKLLPKAPITLIRRIIGETARGAGQSQLPRILVETLELGLDQHRPWVTELLDRLVDDPDANRNLKLLAERHKRSKLFSALLLLRDDFPLHKIDTWIQVAPNMGVQAPDVLALIEELYKKTWGSKAIQQDDAKKLLALLPKPLLEKCSFRDALKETIKKKPTPFQVGGFEMLRDGGQPFSTRVLPPQRGLFKTLRSFIHQVFSKEPDEPKTIKAPKKNTSKTKRR